MRDQVHQTDEDDELLRLEEEEKKLMDEINKVD